MVEQRSPDREHLPHRELCPEILSRINAREQQIEHSLLEARQSAAERLLEARRLADAVLGEHRAEAAEEAARLRDERLAEARRQAAEIQSAAAREAAALRAMPSERIDLVAVRLLALLLPGGVGEGGAP